ncbi:serine/threonine-protein kinase [Paraliomyxa miuraensis]|uniref:serine/threonine-protein kinase n=1 Tax=Paraliomyxa miuraensis TaxID=376150 RepID=UPI0022522B7D|nr:serine/threonine-protein kinase [Paraliomyxa miuraensis]MCX4240337.1 serine/threonine protein kinase [Paraliomyxa miuraensis]
MRRTLQRKLEELSCAKSADALEDEIWDDTGPGKRWQICCHVDKNIAGCPNVQIREDSSGAPPTSQSRRTVDPPPREVPAPPLDPLAARLDAAYQRRESLAIEGEDTTSIDDEILDLRRRLRQGPVLNAGEFLGEGRFRLITEIGHGGFGTVWKAYDRQARYFVAVKVLHGQHVRDTSLRERFFRGARKMAELSHPNIVRVIVPQGEEEGFHYYVMEYLPGMDLHRAVLEKEIDVGQSLVIIESIASALEAAHAKGLVHRDVKPQNILLREDRRPALTDFDLVLARGTTGGTRTSPMGTVIYAAPEQNDDASRVDHRVDIYSLGMSAIFCIYGNRLPQRSMFQRSAFLDELECSEDLRLILSRAVAIDASERFESMTTFRAELAAAKRRSAAPRSVSPLPLQLQLPLYHRWAQRIDDETGVPTSGAIMLSALVTLLHSIPLWICHPRQTHAAPSRWEIMLCATIFVSQISLFHATKLTAETLHAIAGRAARDRRSTPDRLDSMLRMHVSDRRLVTSGLVFALVNVVIGLALGVVRHELSGAALAATLGASVVGFICGMALAGLYGLASVLRALALEGLTDASAEHPGHEGGFDHIGSACMSFALCTSITGAVLSILTTVDATGRPHDGMAWFLKFAWIVWPLLVTLAAFGPASRFSGLLHRANASTDAELGRRLEGLTLEFTLRRVQGVND